MWRLGVQIVVKALKVRLRYVSDVMMIDISVIFRPGHGDRDVNELIPEGAFVMCSTHAVFLWPETKSFQVSS